MEPGQVVEFIENGRYMLAVCTGLKGERLSAVTQTGRETSLSNARLVHVSKQHFPLNIPRNDIQKLLQDRCDLRDELKKDVSIEELWELVQGDEESYEVSFLTEILFGNDCSPDHEAALLRAIIEDKVHFKYRGGLI